MFIAAIIAILVTLLTIVSVAFEWNIFEELKNRFGTVADTPINEEMVVNGVTVVMNGEYRDYTDIEQALKSENIDVLYPGNLLNSMNLERLIISNELGLQKLSFAFINKDLSFEILLDAGIEKYDVKNIAVEIVEINDLTCYLFTKTDVEWCQIYFEYEGNAYELSYPDRQELIKIIENLKELE